MIQKPAEDDDEFIAVLPGNGWRVIRQGQHDPEPVIGWAINRHGYGVPLALQAEGVVEPLSDGRERIHLIPPGEF